MIMLAAGVAAIAGAQGDRELAESMVAAWLNDGRAMVWTSLGNAVLLAGVVADLGLLEYASALRERLDPYRDRIAITGHVGCLGPVALHLAELDFLLGDGEQADELLAHALEIAQRGDGKPSILRCRLLAARMHPRRTGPRRGAGADRGAGQRARRGIGRQAARDLLWSLSTLFQALQVGAKLSSNGGRDCWCTARPGSPAAGGAVADEH